MHIDEIAKILLKGMYDNDCILSKLQGHQHLIETICTLATNEDRWKKCLKLPTKTQLFFTEIHGAVHSEYAQKKDCITFPPPTDIKINMMPFIMSGTFGESKLPNYLKEYWPMIELCLSADMYRKDDNHLFGHAENEIDKVGYLTIEENLVKSGKSQRRPGLHTDNPGKVLVNEKISNYNEGDGWCEKFNKSSSKYVCHHWGFGGCHLISAPVS